MGKDVMIAVALVMTLVFLCFLLAVFLHSHASGRSGSPARRPASITDIIRMRLRRIPPFLIIHTAILLKEYKVAVTVPEIEQFYLAHGAHTRNATELATLIVKERGKPPC